MPTIVIEDNLEMEAIINNCAECIISLVDKEGFPFQVPMNFGYKDGVIYFHSSQEGNKIEIIKNNPNISVCFCSPTQLAFRNENVACTYHIKGKSVICKGKVTFITDMDAKINALNILMKQYTDHSFKYSDPAIKNVCVWKVIVTQMTARHFGVPNKRKVV